MNERAPVRHLAHAGWQVLLSEPEAWLTCKTEDHARLIARGHQLDHAVRIDGIRGEDTASQLDAAAHALVLNRSAKLVVKRFLVAAQLARGR